MLSEQAGVEAYPFLKWAGGKSQLLSQFGKHLPPKFSSYFEPFLGGGAFFFHLYNRRLISSATISDSNQDLINAFIAIRDNLPKLLALAEQLQKHVKDEHYFYDIARPRFNSLRLTTGGEGDVEKAALLLFLKRARALSMKCLNM